MKGSIAARLFWLSAAWLILALVATAFLLTELYSRALDTSLSDTLEFHLETLVGETLAARAPDSDTVAISDPRFARPGSGWYWAIRTDDGKLANLSSSLVGTVLPEIAGPFDATRTRSGVATDAFGTKLRMIEREITISSSNLHIVVTGSLDEIFNLVDDFRGQALIVLGAVGVMLAVMSAIVARFALRPIGRLRQAVEMVREGEATSVVGTFPAEIAPLADEVNQLLSSNAGIIERARNQVGNLAHGLKTPLAVLRNEASSSKAPLAKVVRSETDKMAGMVANYLDRARLAARTTIVGKKADPTIVISRLARVMGKIHPNCTVAFRRPDASLPWFRGDESDLEEMAGNLLDNACKWSNGEVAVSMTAERADSNRTLLIRIEDNGPGLTEEETKKVLRRGVRLDEKTPGSGLGLDIVKELVDVYGGSLQLKRSALGGLLAELRLPAAKLGGIGRS
jgi:signal transduction histidine kinase